MVVNLKTKKFNTAHKLCHAVSVDRRRIGNDVAYSVDLQMPVPSTSKCLFLETQLAPWRMR